jgi:hypothetical protein
MSALTVVTLFSLPRRPPGHGADRREASDVADHVVAVNETEMKLGFRAQPRRAVRK